MILTDEEMMKAAKDFGSTKLLLRIGRNIEAAILKKIGEPVAYAYCEFGEVLDVCTTDDNGYSTPLYKLPEVK